MRSFTVGIRIDAPRDEVWHSITHHEGMVDWAPLRSVTLRVEGESERDGLGAIRVMRGTGINIEEEVVAWDPPGSYEYRLLRGAPIKNHHGRVELGDEGDATRVTWTIRFEPMLPGTGWLIQLPLRKGVDGMLRRLKKRLER